MKKTNNILIQRILSKNPPFWAKVQKYAFAGAVVTAATASIVTGPGWVLTILKFLSTAFITAMSMSQLTTDNHELSKK